MFIEVLSAERRGHPAPSDDYWYTVRAPVTSAGVEVSEHNALWFSDVYKCVDLISTTIASIPTIVYRRLDRGKEKARTHPLFPILRNFANSEMTAFRFKQTLMGHVLTWGNGYAYIARDNANRPRELWPLDPSRMEIRREGSELIYEYRSRATGKPLLFPRADIFHIPGLGYDGLKGYSAIGLLRESVSLGKAQQEFGNRFFGNSAMPGGALVHPGKLRKETKERMRASWNEIHQGPKNSHKVALLEEGLKWEQIGVPPQDAQFLESRKHTRADIAGFYRVPPHMIGDVERSTSWGTGIEQQTLGFLTFTIESHLVNIEQECQFSFLRGDKVHYIEFLMENLLRADTKTRGEFYGQMQDRGNFSINDVREKENMNPIEGGDVHMVPLNFIPLDQFGKLPEPTSGLEEDDEGEPVRSEQRAAANNRRKLAENYRAKFKELSETVVRSETREIRKAVKKFLTQRDVPMFQSWLRQFYEEHQNWIELIITPLWLAYSADVRKLSAMEVGYGGNVNDFDDFVKAFLSTYVIRHVGSSRGQLDKIAREAMESGEDASKLILERLDNWEETRADKMAHSDTVEGAGAFAVVTWIAAGIVRKIWLATGAETCPYCRALDGRTISISQPFIEKGEEFQPEGAKTPLVPHGMRKYPPAHPKCDCMVGAG